jgi:hypothetical protein
MKKNVLALSITAGMLGLGFAGGALAMSVAPLTGSTDLSFLSMNKDGVGHMLLVPYFTAQSDNNTLINITNTDTVNGKAVKVRFRGAANSDDVFDFQVFLSPGDVYAFQVSKDANGNAKFFTKDDSCTKPKKSVLNATPFVTSRVDTAKTGDAKLNEAREGYVEIFNMADIPRDETGSTGESHPYQQRLNVFQANSAGDRTSDTNTVNNLYTAIKHVNKVAPCSGTAWTDLDERNPTDLNDARSMGLLPPSTGLMANWTVINVVGAAAWSGAAAAIQAVNGGTFFTDNPVLGNVVYWPQTEVAVGRDAVLSYSADPLFRSDALRVTGDNGAVTAVGTPAIAAAYYDLPDMSTPYTAAARADATMPLVTQFPFVQARNLTETLASTTITNEFLTDKDIGATTDWVFSMPTRRYNVALNYASTGTDEGRRFSELVANADGVGTTITTGYFTPMSTTVDKRQICVNNVTYSYRDREETEEVNVREPVISPSTPGVVAAFCGEASVLSVNNGGLTTTGALKATVAVRDLITPYTDGWMIVGTPSGGAVRQGPAGLPVIGAAFVKALGNATQTFGAAWPHRNGR